MILLNTGVCTQRLSIRPTFMNQR